MILPSYCALSQATMGIVTLNTMPIVMTAKIARYLNLWSAPHK